LSSFISFFGRKTGHIALFNDLCHIHELDKKTTKLLTQIVQELDLEKSAMIFADPDILKQAVLMPMFSDSMEKLQELYYRWFGGVI